MPQSRLTPQLLLGILIRIPEGFIPKSRLAERYRVNSKAMKQLTQAVASGLFGYTNNVFYDTVRLTADQMLQLKSWCRPQMPRLRPDETFIDAPILEQISAREQRLSAEEQRLVNRLHPVGYADKQQVYEAPEEQALLENLLGSGVLKQIRYLVYDPLRLGAASVEEVLHQRDLVPVREQIIELLKTQNGMVATRLLLDEQYGQANVGALINGGWLLQFSLTYKRPPNTMSWVTFKGADENKARQVATAASRIQDEEWQEALAAAGEVLRPDAGSEGKTQRAKVIARSYTIGRAAQRLGVRVGTVEQAVRELRIPTFTDPQGSTRIPAAEVEQAYAEPEYALRFTGGEVLTAREIALVAGISYSAARHRLHKAGLSRTAPRWEEVMGKWGLPLHLREFRETWKLKKIEWQVERHKAYMAEQARIAEQLRVQQEEERRQRAELRERLLSVFPTWQHDGREGQRVILRLGPPNSGKTHHALEALAAAGSGWYLAPLRLLAFEVFDRLNERGVPCNLLTGEERISVEGARITAATVEMFNAQKSGNCVVIDEAQMLADAERGWAWTRALMEAEAPEIHVLGPFTARKLVEKLARAVSLPVTVVEHQRLAEARVAEKPFRLEKLPPRTILVAFSRAMVLELKTMLETARRSVSVIYGSLPPEVRRRQSDRFADGTTEICVATDAVGMGLNLPADYVCFYEIEKFDGHEVRTLTPGEVQQIGGRAGRYGLSEGGEVGAIRRVDHEQVRGLFVAPPPPLTHARVMPTVEALELLSGSLSQRLRQWMQLGSIPDYLRDVLKTANLNEPIELAQMLRDDEVDYLGLASALRLISAPTRQTTRTYWRTCASAILTARPMPLPPAPPRRIHDQIHLEETEICIACADVYLWLGSRREFHGAAPDELQVRDLRSEWTMLIDEALRHKIEAVRRCARCGRRLPKNHAYGICDQCYYGV